MNFSLDLQKRKIWKSKRRKHKSATQRIHPFTCRRAECMLIKCKNFNLAEKWKKHSKAVLHLISACLNWLPSQYFHSCEPHKVCACSDTQIGIWAEEHWVTEAITVNRKTGLLAIFWFCLHWVKPFLGYFSI